VDQHIITPALYGCADQLRLWADVVGHDDIAPDAVAEEDAEVIIEYLKTVLEAVYTHPATAARLAAKTKELKDRAKGT
jgi:hypothetical protein